MRSGWRDVLGKLWPVAAALACFFALVGTASAFIPRNFDSPANAGPANTGQQFTPASIQRRDTPNDPNYDNAEPDDEDSSTALPPGTVPTSTNIFDERFDLFGFPSLRTSATAIYAEGPHALSPMVSGFNAAGAWKLTRGRPDVAVAYLDTGIRWQSNAIRTQVRLNRGELPIPNTTGPINSDSGSLPACSAFTGTGLGGYDVNNDGAFNVLDYACDPRVNPLAGPFGATGANATFGRIDGEDLIVAFSGSFSGGGKAGGADDDNNGFVDDIAGWDFFDNDNDPNDASSYFAASNHGTGRASEVAERGNDGQGEIGVCPRCQLIPIRTWDTFVSDGNTFGMGILYATDNGASVIEGANGSVYHSAFAEQASNYAYTNGVVQTFSGDDLNTGNHNYAANYSHVMLIEGTVPDTVGIGMDAGNQFAQGLAQLCGAGNISQNLPLPTTPPIGCPGTSLPVKTYFRGANTTQYGGKSSISMEGTTGSANTGKAAGSAALVISAARDAGRTLTPDETRIILEQTAERVTGGPAGVTGNVAGAGLPDIAADPSKPSIDQWSPHFGWGRVNLGDAVRVANSATEVPPEAAIQSPDWYTPTTGQSVTVTGTANRVSNPGAFTWRLEWGVGEMPASWTQFGTGTTTQVSGSVNLATVRQAIAAYTPPPDPGEPTFSPTSVNPFKNEFTVRLVVTGTGAGAPAKPGVDRRVLSSAEDPDLRPGFPKRMGTGGEAPIRYADLNGDNVQELVVPAEDGFLHAYEPDGVTELPNWPVQTRIERQALGHETAPGFAALEAPGGTPPREPLRGATIADLDDDGQPEIIDSAGTHIYVWEPDGSLRPGFPVESDLSNCTPDKQSQPLRHPKCGFVSSPSVARLDGPTQPFDIVDPGLDGRLYAFNNAGQTRPGFPLRLVDPGIPAPEQMVAESINEPAIGDLTGDGTDDIVVATNETYDAAPPSGDDIGGLFGQALSDLLAGAAGGSDRVYAINGATGQYIPGWPIKLNGAIQSTLPLIGPGQNPSIAKIGGATRVVASTTGSATIGVYRPDGSLERGVQQGVYGPGSDATDRTGTINLFESASLGKLIPGGALDIVKYGLTLSDVANLLLSGQNIPYNHLIGAYNAQTGATEPAFPRITDDFQFLSSSDIANVNGSATSNQVVAGNALGLLHAYDGVTGMDVDHFPKVTGGWLFAPAAFSDDNRMADITREGYLFQWNLPDLPKCQTEWPSFRHDQQASGNYDRDGTQPYKPTAVSVSGATLAFTAPGDDYGCGTATKYQIVTSDDPIDPTNFASAATLLGPPAPASAGTPQTYALPSTVQRYVAIRAVDEAGNVGWAASADRGPAAPPPTPSADATVTISDAPDPVTVGQELTYTLTARNVGPGDPAQSTGVTDVLPAGTTFVSATSSQGTCSQASGTVTCNLGTLNAGGANNATITIKVTPQVTGSITDTASISSPTSDPIPNNNSDSEMTNVVAQSGPTGQTGPSGPTGSTGPSGPSGPVSGPCANLQLGSAKANKLMGTPNGDRLLGFGGKDKLFGLGGDDCVNGGSGNDTVSGGGDTDKVVGQRGRDVLTGGPGIDTIYGNGGRDHLFGGAGNDTLLGGIDQDVLNAKGGGKDIVDCGIGRHDVAIVDKSDKVKRCETVRGK